MKKIFLFGAMVCALGMMSACKSGTTNDAAADTITSDTMTENTDSIISSSETTPVDTIPDEQNDGVVSKAIDITLPLYTFKSQEVHDKLQQIVGGWKDDYSALEITFWPTVDTITARYAEDTIHYGYNLMVNSVHYGYHGNAYEDITSTVAGCCMIGKKFCYIQNRLTRDRLFTKTTERKHHTVYSTYTVCPCTEYEDYFLLGDDDNMDHLSFDYKRLHGMTIPNR
ncbi:MAG: hypothetical protein K6A94_07840 [Bacteroidales bacterium]|nr:hypothetical protein [Bacteroidales bacterium]